jgi:hypothetical protein
MEKKVKNIYDLSLIALEFGIMREPTLEELDKWLNFKSILTALQKTLFETLCQEMKEDGDYWNEEELKIQFVGLLFRIADINVKHKIKVFYERPISAIVKDKPLNVVADCLVAKPMEFNTPQTPFFFLQEFKKGKGEKKDPEAQMLVAMLIAQTLNNNDKPIYGGFLVGSIWVFAILEGSKYCTSRKFDAANKEDLLQIIFMLRYLKEIAINEKI